MAAYDDMIASRPIVDEQVKIAGARAAQNPNKAVANPPVDSAADAWQTAQIYDRQGNLVTVYAEGPNAGHNVDTGELVLQGERPAPITGGGNIGGGDNPVFKKLISTYTDPATGDIIDVYDNGDGTTSESLRKKGTAALNAATNAAATAAAKKAAGQSAYDLLYSKFAQYGLGSLVEPLKNLITTGAGEAELTMALRDTDAYKKRFAGNEARIQKGLRALDEATYVGLEDQYQNVMRNYGLPASYWQKDDLGTQKGFTDLIANDVSATELERRVQNATDFIDKGPKAYVDAIKQFYPEVQRGDLLAYVLDPKNALTSIQSKIGAAKIGGEYLNAGLTADQQRAEELQRMGVTAEQARQGAQQVKEVALPGSQLAEMYKLGPYGQSDVEAEVYGLGNAAEAKKKRERIVGAATADFSGQSGVGALGRDRAGLY